MIVIQNPSWIRIVLFLRGTALQRVWPRVIFVTVVATLVTIAHTEWHVFRTNLTVTPFTLVGLALSIFLGFRNNTSYDRFWEGRKLWGSLVNQTRSMARQVVTLVAPYSGSNPDVSRDGIVELHRELVHAIAGYAHALRMHLRDVDDVDALRPFFDDAALGVFRSSRNRPITILEHLGKRVRFAFDKGLVHPQHVPLLEGSLEKLTDIQGGCERIKSTPIPFSYTVLIHRIVAVYCFCLPFGLVDTIMYYTPVVTTFIAYAFFGLDALGDEIEDPFGTDPSDLPLDAISRMIEVNLRQTLGETELPPFVAPVKDVLS
jgi:putative membrane protein